MPPAEMGQLGFGKLRLLKASSDAACRNKMPKILYFVPWSPTEFAAYLHRSTGSKSEAAEQN